MAFEYMPLPDHPAGTAKVGTLFRCVPSSIHRRLADRPLDRFRELNVRSNEQLDSLVQDAQRVIRGVEPQTLRDNAGLRQHVALELSRVQSALDGMLVDRPRRNILRRAK